MIVTVWKSGERDSLAVRKREIELCSPVSCLPHKQPTEQSCTCNQQHLHILLCPHVDTQERDKSLHQNNKTTCDHWLCLCIGGHACAVRLKCVCICKHQNYLTRQSKKWIALREKEGKDKLFGCFSVYGCLCALWQKVKQMIESFTRLCVCVVQIIYAYTSLPFFPFICKRQKEGEKSHGHEGSTNDFSISHPEERERKKRKALSRLISLIIPPSSLPLISLFS